MKFASLVQINSNYEKAGYTPNFSQAFTLASNPKAYFLYGFVWF